MAIDFEKTREIVLFEIDRKSPHDLYRFHRMVSRAIATDVIGDDMFEEVIGCYEGVMNVAYAMDAVAFHCLLGEINYFVANQLEVYHYNLITLQLCKTTADHRTPVAVDWCVGHAWGEAGGVNGWTYFPSAGLYFTLLRGEV